MRHFSRVGMLIVVMLAAISCGSGDRPTAEPQDLTSLAEQSLPVQLSGEVKGDAVLDFEVSRAPRFGTLDGTPPEFNLLASTGLYWDR